MRRDQHAVTGGDRDGVLEIGPRRQQRAFKRRLEPQFGRCIAPPEAQRPGAAGDRTEHGIIRRPADRPVMMQEGVGHRAEAGGDALGIGEHRLAAAVRRGRDQGPAERLQQQVVQRRIGQHEPDLAEAGCDGGCKPACGFLLHEHDGAPGRAQQRELPLARPRKVREGLGDHHRQRLRRPVLALAQPRDGLLIGGIAQQVIAADALHRHDGAAPQRRGAGGDGLCRAGDGRTAAIVEGQLRPAGGTGEWLGVVAPVRRVLVFGPAVRAHGEAGHGCVGAVIGQPVDDRVARPALGAVGERIAIAPCGGVGHLGEAVGAHEMVGRQRAARRSVGAAGFDREAVERPHLCIRHLARLGNGQRRRFAQQGRSELRQGRGLALGVNLDLAAAVAHPAPHAQAQREAEDEGTVAHALHAAAHHDAPRRHHGCCGIHRGFRPAGARRARGCRRPTRCGRRPRPRPCRARWVIAACRPRRRAGIRAG